MKLKSIPKNFQLFLPFSIDFNHSLFNPNNRFLILGQKKKLKLFLLNSEFLKKHLKHCFFYFQQSLVQKIPIIFVGNIKNEMLSSLFKFFCAKNKLIFLDLKKESNSRKYRLFLKTKNLVMIGLFLNSLELNELKIDSEEFNIPLVLFSDLETSRHDLLTSFSGPVNYDYIQFLIILTLINIYEQI